jgi:hypothetical protein
MKRNASGLNLSDCHAFVCRSEQAAMVLVDACAHAYANPRGWSSEVPTLLELGLEKPDIKIDNECYVDDVDEGCSKEYYDKPSLKGYFYAPRSDIIQKFDIGDVDARGMPICSCEPVEDFTTTCCEPEQPTCGPGAQMMCVQPLQPCPPAASMLMYPAGGQQVAQQLITPQQAQIYYPTVSSGGFDYDSYVKSHLKAQKKERKGQKKALEENVYMQQLPQCSGQEEIYARRLPVAAQNVYTDGRSCGTRGFY